MKYDDEIGILPGIKSMFCAEDTVPVQIVLEKGGRTR